MNFFIIFANNIKNHCIKTLNAENMISLKDKCGRNPQLKYRIRPGMSSYVNTVYSCTKFVSAHISLLHFSYKLWSFEPDFKEKIHAICTTKTTEI